MTSSDSECGDDAVFLSPEEDLPDSNQDHGASPVLLRRSNHKRKSTSAPQNQGMPGGSSPAEKSKEMPGVSRSPEQPQRQQPTSQQQACGDGNGQTQGEQSGQGYEALLLAMEARLSAKIEMTVKLAEITNEGLDKLELKVNANDASMREALAQSETRIMDEVGRKVKSMVEDQLRAAGFDQDLWVADLSVRRSVTSIADSYARVASCLVPSLMLVVQQHLQEPKSKEEMQEDNFWVCCRLLKLWPVKEANKAGVEAFLLNKLRLDRDHVEELGELRIRKGRSSKNKDKDKKEVIVTFENKQQKDSVKAKATNLANYRDKAGMRLHVPDHLLKRFHALMNVSYNLKKKRPNLKV